MQPNPNTSKLFTIPKLVVPQNTTTSNQKIPRIIHQTFKTSTVPIGMYQSAKSWIEYNHDYEYRFYDDEDCLTFLKDNFNEQVLQAYCRIEKGAFKADLWRYCALYINGGVYADIDTVCQRSLLKLIQTDDKFIVSKAFSPKYSIYNAFICSIPQHPFLRKVIDRAVALILSEQSSEMFAITGPIGLGIAMNLELGRAENYPFEVGQHNLGNLFFRILEKNKEQEIKKRKVLDQDETVFLVKYEDYFDDLESISIDHWTKNSDYSNLFNK